MTNTLIPDSIFELDGWCPKEKGLIMYDLVIKSKSKLTVELGVFGGRSFIPMALAHKALGIGKCVAIDPWQNTSSTTNYSETNDNYKWWNNLDHEAIYNKFVDSLNKYEVFDIVDIIRKESKDTISYFKDDSIDVLHQDGNHSEGTSSEEVNLYASKIKKNGYWIMDDTNWETTYLAQKLLLSKGFVLIADHKEWKIFQKIQ